jgi:hypothetical protein
MSLSLGLLLSLFSSALEGGIPNCRGWLCPAPSMSSQNSDIIIGTICDESLRVLYNVCVCGWLDSTGHSREVRFLRVVWKFTTALRDDGDKAGARVAEVTLNSISYPPIHPKRASEDEQPLSSDSRLYRDCTRGPIHVFSRIERGHSQRMRWRSIVGRGWPVLMQSCTPSIWRHSRMWFWTPNRNF